MRTDKTRKVFYQPERDVWMVLVLNKASRDGDKYGDTDLADAVPPPRTKWTRRVPHPVLIGHAASLSRGAPWRARQVGVCVGGGVLP